MMATLIQVLSWLYMAPTYSVTSSNNIIDIYSSYFLHS